MIYSLAADATALAHLLFILFVIGGALLGRRSLLWRVLHLASMAYGVFIEIFYWYCPLTLLEQYLRVKAGTGEYSDSFIVHYLNELIYWDVPQWLLITAAAVVLTLNVSLYLFWWKNSGRRSPA